MASAAKPPQRFRPPQDGSVDRSRDHAVQLNDEEAMEETREALAEHVDRYRGPPEVVYELAKAPLREARSRMQVKRTPEAAPSQRGTSHHHHTGARR
jgi:hypothetical protein